MRSVCSLFLSCTIAGIVLLLCGSLNAQEVSGQRVFSAGHSFHMFVPRILSDLADKAGKKGHQQVGTSSIGGSRVIQHWDVADDKNKAKAALRSGKVDVLTLSPIYLPDEGIEKFVALGLEHNPKIRVTVQEFWLPFDVYDPNYKKNRPKGVDHDAPTAKQLREMHEPYFASMDAHVKELNEKFGKQAVFVVPVGQAVNELRSRIIAGKVPEVAKQSDLFRDAIGHPTPVLQALVAYCHFAVTYRQSPVGLPVPTILGKSKNKKYEELNRILQEIAWDAVVNHPLSGVQEKQ